MSSGGPHNVQGARCASRASARVPSVSREYSGILELDYEPPHWNRFRGRRLGRDRRSMLGKQDDFVGPVIRHARPSFSLTR